MEKNSPIGFFDSGVGGLSVYSRFRAVMPFENTIYYADLKNLPYGNKTQTQLIGFARNILDLFKAKGVKSVVIACNTSSALAYDYIKDDYEFKIYPIIQSCAKIIAGMDIKRVGVFATEGTVKSNAYAKELCKYNSDIEVKSIACPNWVSIVEGVENNINANFDIKRHMQEMLAFSPDKIILGCTHYPYLLDKLAKFAPRDMFLDPAEIFVDYLKRNLMLNASYNAGYEEFYVSADAEKFLKNSELFYNVTIPPQIVSEPLIYNV